jgi:class 3 adenylate cyclase
VTIADELTVVGPPVVGAVRMVTASAPKEVVANVFLGERLRDQQVGAYEALGVRVAREFRPTKEYPRGQEVYTLTFDDVAVSPDADESV